MTVRELIDKLESLPKMDGNLEIMVEVESYDSYEDKEDIDFIPVYDIVTRTLDGKFTVILS